MLSVYSAEQVHAALPWPALVAALAEAFAAPGDDAAQVPLRHAHTLGGGDTLLLMPAWHAQALGIKLVTVMPDAPARGERSVQATYVLLDRHTGVPRALLDGEALTVRRTAAASVLAARYLARANADTLVMVGTGTLAPYLIRAYVAMRPALQRVLVWGRSAARAQALVHTLHAEGLPVEHAPVLADAVAQAAIVCCATTATKPVVFGTWIQPGTHLDLVGGFTPSMREVDDDAMRMSRVVVDTFDGALREAGDVVDVIARGVITRDHVTADLAALIRDARHTRRDPHEVTLFKSVGTALEDLAAATLVVGPTSARDNPR